MARDGPEPVPAGMVLPPPADGIVTPQAPERVVRHPGDVRVRIGDVGVVRPKIEGGFKNAHRLERSNVVPPRQLVPTSCQKPPIISSGASLVSSSTGDS